MEQREIYFYSFDDNQPYRYLGENGQFIQCETVINGVKRSFAKNRKSTKNYMFINKKQLNSILEYLTQIKGNKVEKKPTAKYKMDENGNLTKVTD